MNNLKKEKSLLSANERLSTTLINKSDFKVSTFNRDSTHKTTFNSAEFVPFYLDEALPSDSFKINVSALIRQQTPLHATMDNSFVDIAFFKVPKRLCWDKFKYFMGENDSEWFQQNYNMEPQIVFDYDVGYTTNDWANYLGLPVGVSFYSNTADSKYMINALPMRAVLKVWNDWYRDENFQSSYDITANNSNNILLNLGQIAPPTVPDIIRKQFGFGKLYVSKLPDYFTTCLPNTQKGNSVSISLGKYAPIRDAIASEITSTLTKNLKVSGGSVMNLGDTYAYGIGKYGSISTVPPKTVLIPSEAAGYDIGNLGPDLVVESRLVADLTSATSSTVNDLRLSIVLQQFAEMDARGGTRYTELLLNHFGVKSSDARLQRAEYLGGFRKFLNMQQVLQTSSTTAESVLGQVGGNSVSLVNDDVIEFSVEEHSYIVGVCTVRPQHTYANAVPKMFLKKSKFDYYFPTFANIGEQPITKQELFFTSITNDASFNLNNEVFGFNEAWADYKYKLNIATGLFNPYVSSNLSSWIYTDSFVNAPSLGANFIVESDKVVANTIAIQNQPQFIADFYIENKSTRPMPVFNVPGLRKI